MAENTLMTVRGLVLKFEKPLSDKCEGLYPDTRLQRNIRIFVKIYTSNTKAQGVPRKALELALHYCYR